MTIKSMTGFAREVGVTGSHQWAWELKTVNGRGLDVRLRAPAGFDSVAEAARRVILASLARGQCQLNLTVTRSAAASTVKVNRPALAALIEALSGLDLPETVRPASLDGLLAVRGVVEVEGEAGEVLDEALGRDLIAGADRLVAALQAARAAEGDALAKVLSGQLDAMLALVEAAEACPGRQPDAIKARHPNVPWKKMAGAGNVYRHDYEGVAAIYVWDTIAASLPVLQDMVERELKTPDECN